VFSKQRKATSSDEEETDEDMSKCWKVYKSKHHELMGENLNK